MIKRPDDIRSDEVHNSPTRRRGIAIGFEQSLLDSSESHFRAALRCRRFFERAGLAPRVFFVGTVTLVFATRAVTADGTEAAVGSVPLVGIVGFVLSVRLVGRESSAEPLDGRDRREGFVGMEGTEGVVGVVALVGAVGLVGTVGTVGNVGDVLP